MEITKTLEDSTLTVALSGRLDTNTAPDLSETLDQSLEGVKELVLDFWIRLGIDEFDGGNYSLSKKDFENLDYISSAGLRVLLSAQKKMRKQGSMKLVNVSEVVNEIFEVTGFLTILKIE